VGKGEKRLDACGMPDCPKGGGSVLPWKKKKKDKLFRITVSRGGEGRDCKGGEKAHPCMKLICPKKNDEVSVITNSARGGLKGESKLTDGGLVKRPLFSTASAEADRDCKVG